MKPSSLVQSTPCFGGRPVDCSRVATFQRQSLTGARTVTKLSLTAVLRNLQKRAKPHCCVTVIA